MVARNILCYSLLRKMPAVFMQQAFYVIGWYIAGCASPLSDAVLLQDFQDRLADGLSPESVAVVGRMDSVN